MKNIIFINGTMGVGKSSVSRQLNKLLPGSVYLDGDWCWMADPFVVNDETKAMVTDNICHLLNNFIACSQYENIIFCWVMDYESIYESIASKLNSRQCNIYRFTICCDNETLRQRVENDSLQEGRDYEKSLARVDRFNVMDTVKIHNDDITAYETAVKIKEMIYR